MESGSTWYAYRRSWPDNKKIYLHRSVAAASGLVIDGLFVDHRDHDGLNCRRSNLRIATRSQNGMNRRNPASGVRRKSRGSWSASIQAGGKRYYLGSYPSADEAEMARRKASYELHRDFASVPLIACDAAIAERMKRIGETT
ncbi:HNH endonuclease [Phenylobacterium sp.]|uniref:HNH endonuclease n=1 Tax=Phenylobacterium sp. TaxID=1871053 RepID=UPI00345388D4